MRLINYIITLLIFPAIVWAQPKANFGANNTSGCGFLQVVFIDSSSTNGAAIISWKWDLGNNIISDKVNPGRIFDKPGSYKVCLTVTDATGKSDTKCKENFINIFHKPEPNFTISTNRGCSPVNVEFTDLSKSSNGTIKEWIWDIGGSANVISTTDKSQIIKSSYTFAGLYSMSLKVKDEKGCEAVVSKKDILTVSKVPPLALEKKIINSCELPWMVSLKNNNIDPLTSYNWNFGNGQQYNGSNPPTITYTSKENYTLTVISKKGECIDTTILKDYVNTNPKKEITIEKQNICLGEEVKFKDNSELVADSVKWVFGDGKFSNNQNPSHVYQLAGCFAVKLYRFRGSCTDTLNFNCVNIIKQGKPNYTIDNKFTCTVPITINAKGNTIGKYNWELNGPSVNQKSSNQNSSFTISKFGEYKVYMSFEGPQGCIYRDSQDIAIKKFEANLPSQFIGGCVPYTVELGDSIITEVPVTKYEWKVGGSNAIFTSTEQKPKFTLKEVGTFDIRLIVTNTFGCKDTVLRKDYVKGGTKPIVDFITSPDEACLNIERIFSAKTSNNSDYWQWDFGDGGSVIGKDVKHMYANPGVYNVSLFAAHNGCFSSLTKEKIITVLAPISNYKIDYQCADPFTVKLNNLSLGADSLYWTIFNGTKRDTLRDSILTSYTFPGVGKYTLSIYSKNFNTGCEHNRLDTIYITQPKANYDFDTLRGCLPLTINLIDKSKDAVYSRFVVGVADSLLTNSITYDKGGIQALPKLLIRDRHGCADSLQLKDNVFVNKIKARFDYEKTLCIPKQTIFNSTSIDSFAKIVKYSWLVSDSSFTLADSFSMSILNPGNIKARLIVEDDWACKDSLEVDDITAILLSPDFTNDSLGCTRQEILFSPLGDNLNTGKYLWEFSHGVTDSVAFPKIKFPSEGKYDVCLTLSDVRGCENKICKPSNIDIKDPKANFIGDPLMETCPPLLSNFENKSINAVSFVWDFGDNNGLSFVKNPSHIYFEPGAFDVQLIAIRSDICRDTMTIPKYVNVLGPKGDFKVDIAGNCTNLKATFTGNTDDFYRYFWDFGNGVIDSSLLLQKNDVKEYTYTSPGIFYPKLIVSDNQGCNRSFSSDPIIVNDIDIKMIADKDRFCGVPSSTIITNKSTSSSISTFYNWKVINETDTTLMTGENINVDFLKLGKYEVLLLGSTENCIMESDKPLIIEVFAQPQAAFNIDANLACQFNEIKFSDKSIISQGSITKHLWTIESKEYEGIDILANFSKEGNHAIKLVVISEHQCKDSIQKEIQILPNASIDPLNDTIICIDEIFTLNGKVKSSQTYSSSWSENTMLICNNCLSTSIAPKSLSTYVFEVVSQNGCINRDTMTISIAPVKAPSLDLTSDTILCNGVESIISVLNPNNDYTYEWLGHSKDNCLDNCKKFKYVAKEDATLIAQASNKYGCLGKDTINIKVEKAIPDFLIAEKYICEKASVKLSIDSLQVVNWSEGNKILCSNCNTITLNPTQDTHIKATVKSINHCIYTDSVFVSQVPLNSVKVGDNLQICKGENIKLTSKGIGNSAWTFENNEIGNQALIDYSPLLSGDYKVSYTKDECTLSDSLYIEVLTKADIKAFGDTVCFGEILNLEAEGLAHEYKWYLGNSLIASGAAMEAEYKETETIMVIGSRTTCESDTAMVSAFVYPFIDYILLKVSYDLYYNTKQKIEVLGNKDNYTYQWSPPQGLSCADCFSPIIENLEEKTIYTVSVKDKESGCEKLISLNTNLMEECSPKAYYIPNIINLGITGSFSIKAAHDEDFRSIIIRDRWGNVIWNNNDINSSWDGRLNGQKVNTGVYTYIVTAYCPEKNEEFVFYGDVTVLH